MASGRTANGTGADRVASGDRALKVLGFLLLGGLLVIVVHGASQSSNVTAMASICTGLMIAAASVALGALAGFLFGIPRSMQSPAVATDPAGAPTRNEAAYGANTNLEQISDWLTKILVGVGLTQLASAPTHLQSVSLWLASSLGSGVAAAVLAGAILIYFSVCGFLFAYLWTRLFLAAALRGADLEAIGRKLDALESQSTRDARALEAVHAFLDSSESSAATTEKEMRDAVAGASPVVRSTLFLAAQRQRKNNWTSAGDKQRMSRTTPVFRALIDAGDKTFEHYAQLGYALKDQIKPNWQGALDALNEAILLRGTARGSAAMYHEFNRAICRIAIDPDAQQNKPSKSESLALIRSDLAAAMSNPHLREIVVRDEGLTRWATLNGLELSKL